MLSMLNLFLFELHNFQITHDISSDSVLLGKLNSKKFLTKLVKDFYLLYCQIKLLKINEWKKYWRREILQKRFDITIPKQYYSLLSGLL